VSAAFAPTAEQQDIYDIGLDGPGNMVIVAGAGTGKTATLEGLAERTRKHGRYIVYNKAPALEAAKRFPSHIECSTAHKLAYRPVGVRYKDRMDNQERVPNAQAARILGIHYAVTFDDKVLQPAQLARLALETVDRFCHSADPELSRWHTPVVPGLEEPAQRRAVETSVYPLAVKAWDDLQRVKGGKLRYTPDMFLKSWALTDPVIDGDFALYDECQDADKVMLGVMLRQKMKIVAVGDPNQSIYAWRGAVDALDRFDAQHRLVLSQSFRFGPDVADEANVWLELLDAELRIKGFDKIRSVVGPLDVPRAILCRTNAGAMNQVMSQMSQRRRVYLTGGGKEIEKMAEAAIELKAGRGTGHPELCAFQTWAQLQDYCEESHDGGDLKVFVQLIDRYGPETIISTVRRLAWKPERADVTVATVHKTKGLEFPTVLIGPDFREPEPTEDGQLGTPSREELMLNYVAMTRAQQALDTGGLGWGRKYLVSASV
jgi:AAA domain/UvrD-like helicase C-terminal domain